MRTIEDIKTAISYYEKQQKTVVKNQSFIHTIKELESELRGALIDGIPLDRLEEICNAERDGRCVVLDGKPLPLIWGDGENTLHCPNCDKDLMGGFAECYDSEKQMWQCPNCGQAIDSRKAVTRGAWAEGAEHD